MSKHVEVLLKTDSEEGHSLLLHDTLTPLPVRSARLEGVFFNNSCFGKRRVKKDCRNVVLFFYY